MGTNRFSFLVPTCWLFAALLGLTPATVPAATANEGTTSADAVDASDTADRSDAARAAAPETNTTTVGELPRLADGTPNLSGVWQAFNNANYDIEPHSARAALATVPGEYGPVPAPEIVRLGAVGAVPGGPGAVARLPYHPSARQKQQENRADWLNRDPEIKCYLPGVPRATYLPFPLQIFQSDTQFFISYEYAGAVRNIYLDDPGEAPAESWMGQSVGRWEGDTFVVRVTDQNDQTWFDRAGNFHSAAMVVTERYTLVDANTIRYEATIEDAEVFTAPWTLSLLLYRRLGEDARLHQFKCVEFVEELLYGHLRQSSEANEANGANEANESSGASEASAHE